MSETAVAKTWWGRLHVGAQVGIIVAAAVLVGVIVTVIVMMNGRPSFAAVAGQCGKGVLVASDTLVVDPQTATTDTLVCVTTKLLSDSKDQYTVARAVDAGTDTTLHLEGYTVDVVAVGDSAAVSFSR